MSVWDEARELSAPVAEFNEPAFQSWYQERATKAGINPNPDDPRHKYDYRAAYSAGAEPEISPGKSPRNTWLSRSSNSGEDNVVAPFARTEEDRARSEVMTRAFDPI